MGKGEILSLTGLRFIAAFYVFIFHIHIRWPLTSSPFLKSVVDQGAIGMSLFFVLSGFLLAYRYSDNDYDYKEFWINRFARIYPVYALSALLTLPWFGIDHAGSFFGKEFFQSTFLIFTNIFLIQAWFPQLFVFWNDGGSWSISVEAFFYVLFPLVLGYVSRLSLKNIKITLVICWIFSALPGISASLFNTPSIGIFYSVPIFRFSEFLIGMCTYFLIYKGFKYNVKVLFQTAIFLLFFAYIGLCGNKLPPIYIGHNWIVIPFLVFVIFLCATQKNFLVSLFSSKVFVFLGKISYCFYAFQSLVILPLMTHHDRIVQFLPILKNNRILFIISFLTVLIISTVSYYFVEEPARKWIRKYYRKYSERQVPISSLETSKQHF